jgi:general stress protein YciG
LKPLRGQITVREAGARGGRTTLERKGREFFREIAKKGGKRTAELYHDLLAEFGKQGGRPRRPGLSKSEGEKGHSKKEVGGRPLAFLSHPNYNTGKCNRI